MNWIVLPRMGRLLCLCHRMKLLAKCFWIWQLGVIGTAIQLFLWGNFLLASKVLPHWVVQVELWLSFLRLFPLLHNIDVKFELILFACLSDRSVAGEFIYTLVFKVLTWLATKNQLCALHHRFSFTSYLDFANVTFFIVSIFWLLLRDSILL